jgi:predicted GNAT superfamily acetyltransferase
MRSGAHEVFQVAHDAHGLARIERENELNGACLLVEIPADLAAVKGASADLARQWRECTRGAFARLFAQGYAAVGFVFDGKGPGRRAAYVLSNAPLDLGPGANASA